MHDGFGNRTRLFGESRGEQRVFDGLGGLAGSVEVHRQSPPVRFVVRSERSGHSFVQHLPPCRAERIIDGPANERVRDTTPCFVFGHQPGTQQLLVHLDEGSWCLVEHLGRVGKRLPLSRDGENCEEVVSICGKLRQSGLEEILHRGRKRGLIGLGAELHSSCVGLGRQLGQVESVSGAQSADRLQRPGRQRSLCEVIYDRLRSRWIEFFHRQVLVLPVDRSHEFLHTSALLDQLGGQHEDYRQITLGPPPHKLNDRE